MTLLYVYLSLSMFGTLIGIALEGKQVGLLTIIFSSLFLPIILLIFLLACAILGVKPTTLHKDLQRWVENNKTKGKNYDK